MESQRARSQKKKVKSAKPGRQNILSGTKKKKRFLFYFRAVSQGRSSYELKDGDDDDDDASGDS